MRLILLGPPGIGKGSLASALKNEFGILHISTGDILREEIKGNTALGAEAKKYIDQGQLVPDELVTKLIENKFSQKDFARKGYLLDGFPRTVKQARDLDAILQAAQKPYDYVVCMEGTLPVILQRLTGRRVCKKCGHVFHLRNKPSQKAGICDSCGSELYQRPDDNEETLRTRMDVYLKSTKPIIDYYERQGKLKRMDGDKESEELEEILTASFHEDRKLHKH